MIKKVVIPKKQVLYACRELTEEEYNSFSFNFSDSETKKFIESYSSFRNIEITEVLDLLIPRSFFEKVEIQEPINKGWEVSIENVLYENNIIASVNINNGEVSFMSNLIGKKEYFFIPTMPKETPFEVSLYKNVCVKEVIRLAIDEGKEVFELDYADQKEFFKRFPID